MWEPEENIIEHLRKEYHDTLPKLIVAASLESRTSLIERRQQIGKLLEEVYGQSLGIAKPAVVSISSGKAKVLSFRIRTPANSLRTFKAKTPVHQSRAFVTEVPRPKSMPSKSVVKAFSEAKEKDHQEVLSAIRKLRAEYHIEIPSQLVSASDDVRKLLTIRLTNIKNLLERGYQVELRGDGDGAERPSEPEPAA